ncbi:MAG: heme-copper oxidase subunit III [Planctomycetaceae bacterium]|nr:heme-copper oxidase subunit III [Planctomycetaceae bacterium]
MSIAAPTTASPPHAPLSRGKVGMALLIFMESVFFSGFIVTYLFYIGRSSFGPQPSQVLELGPVIVNSICLWSSSITVWFAVKSLRRGSLMGFRIWMTITVLLGLEFIVGTGLEWKGLIEDHGLTIRTNVFGSNFFSLVGFHAFHVCVGLLMLTGTLVLSFIGGIRPERDHERVDVLTWYWHFVDVVWIAVFLLVYVVGRGTGEVIP